MGSEEVNRACTHIAIAAGAVVAADAGRRDAEIDVTDRLAGGAGIAATATAATASTTASAATLAARSIGITRLAGIAIGLGASAAHCAGGDTSVQVASILTSPVLEDRQRWAIP